ncbi:MAG TPA: 50S ribosomal protein L6 [Phycisphaerae bacterium]|nr:50S ribosomal protein L6 [Phycisphaerales bacterium]HRX85800.1 50S ribosomal protein L6 [Phycisphaerae bacterium]
MSRIGKKPIAFPAGVDVSVSGQTVRVKGAKGELTFGMPHRVAAKVDNGSVVVSREGEDRQIRALHGMTRAMIANMVTGVSAGFEKKLEIYGTGYGCTLAGNALQLNCGFMGRGGKNKPQFIIQVPKGLEVEVQVAQARGENDPARLTIRGCDRQQVGQFAAEIRGIRPPEPYKGKGIRYHDEVVKRKAGKALASGG